MKKFWGKTSAIPTYFDLLIVHLFVCLFLCFGDRFSLWITALPETYYVHQVGPELTKIYHHAWYLVLLLFLFLCKCWRLNLDPCVVRLTLHGLDYIFCP